ncbi:MAG: proline dehydrogenase family protein [Bacteroidota bacterium]
MVDFQDTQNAFEGKTDAELRSAYRLFNLMDKRWFVAIGKVLLSIALFIRFPIGWIVKPTIFRHFCGGETIDECEQSMKALAARQASSIPDYSAEGKATEASYDFVTAEISSLIAKAQNNAHIPFAVFKPSGIGSPELLEKVSKGAVLTADERGAFARFEQRYVSLCKRAYEADVPLMADAEEFNAQPAIDAIVVKMAQQFNKKRAIVFNTLQLYRTDRLSYLHEIILKSKSEGWHCGFKLVRGAYLEKERKRAQIEGYTSPTFSTKSETDTAYNHALKLCLANYDSVSICAGTHNEESAQLLATLIDEKGLQRNIDTIWFSQLYGMSDHISFNLAKAGYNVCKYVPYGPVKTVMPYLVRRAEENTAIAGQTGRELMLIRTELSRRKVR